MGHSLGRAPRLWLALVRGLLGADGRCGYRLSVASSGAEASGDFLFHLSLVWILLGALVTHVWGVQGRVHLRQGEAVEAFTLSDGQTSAFPFRLSLEEFRVEYYAGTSAPKTS